MAMHTKLKGKVVARFYGFVIYVDERKAKRGGKDRIWISIRQNNPPKYRVSESLSYMRSVDVQFETAE